jgi:hypothetical protein
VGIIVNRLNKDVLIIGELKAIPRLLGAQKLRKRCEKRDDQSKREE